MSIFSLFHNTTDNTRLPPINDNRVVPNKIEDFKECHLKVLKRLNKHAVKEDFSGLISLEVDIPKFVPVLIKLNLIEIVPYSEALLLMKNDALKSVLRFFNLKMSGKKTDLINRILENTLELDVRSLDEYSDFYVLTELGQRLVMESFTRFEQERLEFFEKAVKLINDGELNQAYRMICKRNAEMPVPPGLGCDWGSRYKNGLGKPEEQIYLSMLNSDYCVYTSAVAIYINMSGESFFSVVKNCHKAESLRCVELEEVCTVSTLISVEIDFRGYEDLDIEKYQYLGTLDKDTCPVCRKLDGKIYYVKDREIGVNCPPMHKGCRCTTVAKVRPEDLAKRHRRARDLVKVQ